MKAISLWQPWATLIAIGAKQYETRHWAVKYRGPVIIHAAKTRSELGIIKTAPFAKVLVDAGYFASGDLPFGAAVAFAWIIGCHPTHSIVQRVSTEERAFGDWSYGRYAWELVRVCMLPEPIPMTGRQSLFDAPAVPELSEGAYRDLLRAKNAEFNPEADSHDDHRLITPGYAADESGRDDTPPSARYFPELEPIESAPRGALDSATVGNIGGGIASGIQQHGDGGQSTDGDATEIDPAAAPGTPIDICGGLDSLPVTATAPDAGRDHGHGDSERDQRGDRDGGRKREGMGAYGVPTPPDAADNADGLQLSLFD
jgi:hypothetical protein